MLASPEKDILRWKSSHFQDVPRCELLYNFLVLPDISWSIMIIYDYTRFILFKKGCPFALITVFMMFYLTFLSLRKNGFDGFSMFFSSLPGVFKVEIYLELGGKKECPGETMGIGEHTKQGWTINKRCLCQHAQLANKPCEGLRLVKEHSNNLYKHFYLRISCTRIVKGSKAIYAL